MCIRDRLLDLLSYLKDAFSEYDSYGIGYIQSHYLNCLHGYSQAVNFEDNLGFFKGKIAHVSKNGRVQVWRNGKLCSYDLKELKFID
mgnify:FL=1